MKKLIILSLLFAGCASLPFSSPAPKLSEQWSKSEDIVPTFIVTDAKGKQVAASEVHRRIDVNRTSVDSRNIFQKFWGWLLGLGLLGGALAFFFPTAFFTLILWLMNRWKKLKQSYQDHKDALEQTVKAIKESNAVVPGSPLYTALDKHQDDDSKKLIATIRAST